MKHIIITILSLFLVIPAATLAADLDGYSFTKISAYDQKAVVKSPQGELILVGVGDSVGASATIVEISDDRVVLEEKASPEPAILIIRLEGGEQNIQKVQKKMLQGTPQISSPIQGQ